MYYMTSGFVRPAVPRKGERGIGEGHRKIRERKFCLRRTCVFKEANISKELRIPRIAFFKIIGSSSIYTRVKTCLHMYFLKMLNIKIEIQKEEKEGKMSEELRIFSSRTVHPNKLVASSS